MIFLRMGMRIIFLRSTDPQNTKNNLVENLGYRRVTLAEGHNEADENSTLIFITPTGLRITDPKDADYILLANNSGTYVLSDIINMKEYAMIERVDIGPRTVVFRVPGNEDAFASILEKEFDGQRVTWNEGVRLGEREETLISITTERLQQVIKTEDFFYDHILVKQNQKECFSRLNREALFYITHSLEDNSWFEYKISLYDAYENYDKHYQRLIQVFSGLEVGLILGEGWTKDFAHIVMSIMVYQIKLFSVKGPKEIKMILMGLEYDDQGRRLADLDLYHKKRKISWTEVQKETLEKRSKLEEGVHQRKELIDRLPDKEKKILLDLEREIQEAKGRT